MVERGDEVGAQWPRVFCDERDQRWEVRAIRPPTTDRRSRLLPEDHANGWLLFTLGLERRRLAPLPRGWEAATESQLQRWWAEANPIAPRSSEPSIAQR